MYGVQVAQPPTAPTRNSEAAENSKIGTAATAATVARQGDPEPSVETTSVHVGAKRGCPLSTDPKANRMHASNMSEDTPYALQGAAHGETGPFKRYIEAGGTPKKTVAKETPELCAGKNQLYKRRKAKAQRAQE